MLFAGQVVSAEILMASEHGCPIEMHRIQIEKCDEMYDEQCDGRTFMPFHRASYDPNTGQSPNNPREQVRRREGWETLRCIQCPRVDRTLYAASYVR